MQKLRKYRQLIFLGLLLLLGLWIIALQQRRQLPDSAATRLFLRVSAPPLRLMQHCDDALAGLYERLSRGAELQQENATLLVEVTQLRAQRDMLQEQSRSLERLGRLAQDPAYEKYSFIPASVIGRSFSANVFTLKIDKGSADGVQPYSAVIDLNGLAGVTEEVAPHAALVRLAADRYFAVAALIEETRLQGYAQGEGRGAQLSFQFDNFYIRPEPGQAVITSGMAGERPSIVPKGLLIGRVAAAATGDNSLPFATVAPAVDFDTLEEVAILIPHVQITDEIGSATLTTSGTFNLNSPTSLTLESESNSSGN